MSTSLINSLQQTNKLFLRVVLLAALYIALKDTPFVYYILNKQDVDLDMDCINEKTKTLKYSNIYQITMLILAYLFIYYLLFIYLPVVPKKRPTFDLM